MEKIGQNIKHYRKLMKIKQSDLAEQVNVSTTYLGYIEQGKRLPSLDLLVDIAVVYKLPITALVTDELFDISLLQTDAFISELNKLSDSELDRALEILRANYESICLS